MRHNVKRRGAAAVEMAILLPFVALVFSATVDFGRVFQATQVLTSAASRGALAASGSAWVPETLTSKTDAARKAACAEAAQLNPPLLASQVNVSINGGTARVTVTYDFPLLTQALVPDMKLKLTRTVTLPVAPTPGD